MSRPPKLRICVMTAAYPAPSEPTRAIFLENFMTALGRCKEAEVEAITVVSPRVHAVDPARESSEGIDIERFSCLAGGRRLKEFERVPWFTLAAYLGAGLWRLLGAIRRSPPRIIYAHWLLPAGLIGALAALVTGTPLVIHAHGSDVNRYALGSRPASLAARWALRRAALVLAVSGDLSRCLHDQLGVPESRIRHVSMGIDARHFHMNDVEEGAPLPARRFSGERPLELLFVGDLEPWKGLLKLARALCDHPDLLSSVRLHVVGDGMQRPDLEELARGREETILIHGRMTQAEVAAQCRRADLLVLPSRGEGCPLAVMEALACGLPVLATPVGGIPDLIEHGVNGWLAADEDVTTEIATLVDHPERLGEARQRLRDDRRDWSVNTRAKEALRCILEVIGGRRTFDDNDNHWSRPSWPG